MSSFDSLPVAFALDKNAPLDSLGCIYVIGCKSGSLVFVYVDKTEQRLYARSLATLSRNIHRITGKAVRLLPG